MQAAVDTSLSEAFSDAQNFTPTTRKEVKQRRESEGEPQVLQRAGSKAS